MIKLKPGDRVVAYFCPDREMLASRSTMDEDDYAESMTSFTILRGTVVRPRDPAYEMEGDYEWELCVAFDGEEPRARTFRRGDGPLYLEGPYYGGYEAQAVMVKE